MRFAAHIPALFPMAAAPFAANGDTLRWGASRDVGSLDPDSSGDTFTKVRLWLTRQAGN